MKTSIFQSIRLIAGVAIAGAALFVTSCGDDGEGSVAQLDDIVTIASATDDLSTLVTALTPYTDIVNQLSDDSETLTVFAPTNVAFGNFLTALDQTELAGIPSAVVEDVLTYHVVGSVAFSTDLSDGQTIQTLNGESVTVSIDGGVFIDNAQVTTADVEASNGVVHIIDEVLSPFKSTIPEIVVANATAQSGAEFTLLLAALQNASVDLVTVLGGQGPFVVFAPTDAAFNAAGFNSVADIEAADAATLTAILQHHVLKANQYVFSTNLADGNITMLDDGSAAVNVTAGTLTSSGGTVANLATTDIMASNGVIHVIDAVLIPSTIQ